MNAMGPVLYAARLADGVVKLGHTEQLGKRLGYLKQHNHLDVELLAFRPGTRDEEQLLHRALTEHLARGREYYHPTAEVMAAVDAMRRAVGLSALAA